MSVIIPWSDVVYSPAVGLTGLTSGVTRGTGVVGEILSASVPLASAVSLTTGVARNVISLPLTAGDWRLSGLVQYNAVAGTVMGLLISGLNAITGALPNTDFFQDTRILCPATSGQRIFIPTPDVDLNLSAPATWYLIAYAEFSVSTATASGKISARRMS